MWHNCLASRWHVYGMDDKKSNYHLDDLVDIKDWMITFWTTWRQMCSIRFGWKKGPCNFFSTLFGPQMLKWIAIVTWMAMTKSGPDQLMWLFSKFFPLRCCKDKFFNQSHALKYFFTTSFYWPFACNNMFYQTAVLKMRRNFIYLING